ncbi:MAG TPA: OB-fold nucleic acid binding domain-containing protein, partial [Acidimicrobiales bacterium]
GAEAEPTAPGGDRADGSIALVEAAGTAAPATATVPTPDVTPIGSVGWRRRVTVEGRVTTLRVLPLSGTATLECVLEDDSGAMSIVFLGRSSIAGIAIGTRLRAQGMAGMHRGRLAILNPVYQLIVR